MPPSSEAAARFRDLHRQGLLRLANAWDAGTARLIEQRGAAAIATTSAGLAWAQGYADGDRLDPDVLLQAVSRIARVIRVPLTVDVEGGYSDDPDTVAALVLRVVHAGAAGINLEDGAGAPDLLAAKIRAIREACVAQGADVFVTGTEAKGCVTLPAVGGLHPLVAPLVLAVAFYGFVEALARRRGFDPDTPPHLRKVTETV